MNYDFTSYYDRTTTKASKWCKMLDLNPNVKEGIVPMTVADMDFATAPEITKAITSYTENNLLGYSRPTNAYLDSILHFYEQTYGYRAERKWLFTTPGVVPALASAVRALTKPGEGVVIMTPIYGPFYEVVEGQGRKVLSCPLQIINNRYEIDFDVYESLCARTDARLLLFCSPHNPSGRVWTREELVRVAAIAHKHGLAMVSDEIHSDLVVGDAPHIVFNTVSEEASNAILCTSAGKTYNIQALQCANIFIKDPEIYHAFEEENLFVGIERANVLGMVATQAAYEQAGEWRRQMLEVIKTNHRLVEDFFANYSVFTAMHADAGFLCWIDFEKTKLSHDAFMRFLTSCDFYVTDGLFFGKAAELFIRINVGLPTHKLEENLARLKQGLKDQMGLV